MQIFQHKQQYKEGAVCMDIASYIHQNDIVHAHKTLC